MISWSLPPTNAMCRGGAIWALTLALSACSTTGSDDLEGEGSGLDDPYEESTAGGTGSAGGDSNGEDDSPADYGTTSGGAATGVDEGSTGGEEPDSGGAPGEFSGCPDRLPESWIFCEDFEDMVDPADVFFEYQSQDGAFVVVDDQAASGKYSMRASYRAMVEGAGWLSVAFGQNPIVTGERPQYAAASQFDEIYWRMRIRTQPGWPNVGPHKLTRLTAVADPDWSQAMVAHLWSNGDDVVLAGDAASCVVDSEIACMGFGDASLQSLGLLTGETPLFSDLYAGQWHCVEGHVKLNTPGAGDGVFEFWVDDELEASRSDLDWRGDWTEYGINMISIENFWTGGAPQDLDRWIDDVVISSAPIGCQ